MEKRTDPKGTDVLVIGATGYAGSYVAAAFAAAGCRVAALQRPGGRPVPDAYRPVPGDLADPASLTAAAQGFDVVVQVGRIEGDPERIGAEALLASGARLVHTSGVDVLGPGHNHEGTVPAPPKVVAWRAAVERAVLDGGGILVRPGLIYGNKGGVIKDIFVPVAERAGAGVYLGREGIRWPMVHVEDLARLYVLVAERAAPGTAWNGCVDSATVDQIAAAVGRGRAIRWPADQPVPEEIAPIEELFLMDHVVSSERTQRELGWEPACTDSIAVLTQEHA
ncbi:MAG: NAD-dependent epimerase/dehydratase family protein [Frankiaceae bacterium]